MSFHGTGQNYGAVKDIIKYVYDKNGGHTNERVGFLVAEQNTNIALG